MRFAWRALVLTTLLVALVSVNLAAQGPFSSQIQAALRSFAATANTWAGTQTFTNITITGTCTGCGGGGATAINDLGDATGAGAVASADNAQVWTWALSTASKIGLHLSDTIGSPIAGTVVLKLGAVSTSQAMPLFIENLGSGASFTVHNSVGDTTPPFNIVGDKVAINIAASAHAGLQIIGLNNNVSFSVGGGSSDINIATNTNSIVITSSASDPIIWQPGGLASAITFSVAGNLDAVTFSAAGDTGHTGTACTTFTGGLCTTGTAPGELTPDQQEIARLSSELAWMRAELARLRAEVRQ